MRECIVIAIAIAIAIDPPRPAPHRWRLGLPHDGLDMADVVTPTSAASRVAVPVAAARPMRPVWRTGSAPAGTLTSASKNASATENQNLRI